MDHIPTPEAGFRAVDGEQRKERRSGSSAAAQEAAELARCAGLLPTRHRDDGDGCCKRAEPREFRAGVLGPVAVGVDGVVRITAGVGLGASGFMLAYGGASRACVCELIS